jgi:hypothetical protein
MNMLVTSLNRRSFLKAAGATVALPLLESVGGPAAAAAVAQPPRRMIAILACLGLIPEYFFPEKAGRDYESTPYLDILKDHRDSFTIFSGLSHPDVLTGHYAETAFLTGAPNPGRPNFKNSISLDQYAVEKLKPATRFPYLTLGTVYGSASINRNGLTIPSETSPSKLFTKLFVKNTATEAKRQIQNLKDGHSILDTVLEAAKRLDQQVSSTDRERLEQYFNAVRDVEKRLVEDEEWVHRPKPEVAATPPKDPPPTDFNGRLRLMLDIAHLAFQTDQTRLITLKMDLLFSYHDTSHHNNIEKVKAQCQAYEIDELKVLRDFFTKLRNSKEGGATLLDRTMVLYGSNMGNASSHSSINLPIILAGGGFKHGQHVAFDRKNNVPLCKLYVSMLQRLGIETDRFSSGKGRIDGLAFA